MSHEDMSHMGMEHEMAPQPSLDPDANSNSVATGQHHGPCSHCAAHSGKAPKATSLRDTEAAKRTFDVSIPLQYSRVAPVTESAAGVSSRAHGPPGPGPARYILINTFRI